MLTKKFDLLAKGKDYVIKMMRDTDNSKAASIDKLTGRFLKNGPDFLVKPNTDIYNFSISLNKFPSAFKLEKGKPFFKHGQ